MIYVLILAICFIIAAIISVSAIEGRKGDRAVLAILLMVILFFLSLVVQEASRDKEFIEILIQDNKFEYVSDKFGNTTLILKDSTMQNMAKFLGNEIK